MGRSRASERMDLSYDLPVIASRCSRLLDLDSRGSRGLTLLVRHMH